MKALPVLWCLVSFSALGSLADVVAQEKKRTKPKVERAISLFTPQHKLWLHVYSDGAGTVGYGDGGSYQGFFNSGTFDVAQVTTDLKALALDDKSNEVRNNHYGMRIESERTAQEQRGPARYTKDNELILKLFEQAIEASNAFLDSRERLLLLEEIEKCKLGGTWVVASAEADGKPVAELKGTRLTFVDNEMTTELEGKEQSGAYEVDPAKTPKQIELRIGDTSGNWYRSYGVYELDGDELRVCRTGDLASASGIRAETAIAKEVAGGRPAKLDSKLGVLLVLKREAK